MRAVASLLVAACTLGLASTDAAADEWVVLRVERVEVAVAHSDGSRWDDDTPTGETCGFFAGASDLVRSNGWRVVARSLCPARGGSDPTAPDLYLRLADRDEVEYLSPIAPDVLERDMRHDFLVPLEEVTAGSISISVLDHDPAGEELLGTFSINRRDIDRLLVRRDRVKTYSNDSVTRIDLSARRYRAASKTVVRLPPREQAARAAGAVIAGESIEVTVAPRVAYATTVIGGNLGSVGVDRCTRGVATASGGIAVGIQPDFATVDFAAVFTIRRRQPDLALWRTGSLGLSCRGKTALASLKGVTSLTGSSLPPAAVSAILRSRYMQGVNRCHERQIAGRRAATGRLALRLTVGPTGSVTRASAKGFDQTLDACIHSIAKRWRFAAPKDAAGKPTSDDFQVAIRFDVL